MQNEQTIVPGNETPAQPSPQLQSVPGYQTTSGQFTALFTVVALFLGLLGYHYSPEKIETWVELANTLCTTLGPILALVPVLITYVNSRGKIASNALNANAVVMSPTVTEPLVPFKSGVLQSAIGGDSWKDPQRYENLLHIATALGVPGAGAANKVDQQIHPADLITGILGMLHKKTN